MVIRLKYTSDAENTFHQLFDRTFDVCKYLRKKSGFSPFRNANNVLNFNLQKNAKRVM